MREWSAVTRIEAEVEIARHCATHADWPLMEDEREAGVRRQHLAARARGQPGGAEVEGHGTDGADGIDAKLRISREAEAADGIDVVRHTCRRFARHHPDPVVVATGHRI